MHISDRGKQMGFLVSIASVSYWLLSAVVTLIGLATIILAVFNSPWQLQMALGFIGLGFMASGLVYVKRALKEHIDEQRFNQLIARLDAIQEEIKKEERSKGTGVAIADVIMT
jgi:Na+/phosphate symporter